MRIIAGSRKGRRLQVPTGRLVRPTSDRAREALMSALGGFLDGERVLDLCAGTGAMGLELLSRGAGSVVFVDNAPLALTSLRANLSGCRFEDQAEVLTLDVLEALSLLRNRGDRFDLIFFDPPWDANLYAPVLTELAAGAVLAPGAVVIVESAELLSEAQRAGSWRSLASRRYGAAVMERLVLDKISGQEETR